MIVEETVHQYSKMTLRSRKKSIRDLTGGNSMVSRATKKLGLPTSEIVNDKICIEGLEKKILLSVRPKPRYPPHSILLDRSTRNTINDWNSKA